MDLIVTSRPVTPVRAKSTRPSPSAESSMEDADSSSKRKRPRLDSGERVYRSMSADRVNATPVHPGFAGSSPTLIDDQDLQLSTGRIGAQPPSNVTPSKVTINVREPAVSAVQQDPVQQDSATSIRGGAGGHQVDSAVNNLETSNRAEPPSPNVISVASSPPHSPEIEIAEVEDMIDEPGQTRWRPLSSATTAMEAKNTQYELLTSFPCIEGYQSLRKGVLGLAQKLERNDLGDGSNLTALASWIEVYLQTTEPHPYQWWENYLDDQEFWNELPSLVEALLRRSTRSGRVTMLNANDDNSSDATDPLQEFLVAYTSLALRMAQMDDQMLDEDEDAGMNHDLVSSQYLVCLPNLMGLGFPFWNAIVDVTSYDVKRTITAMITRFVLPPSKGIGFMMQMSETLLDRIQSVPALTSKLWLNIAIIIRIVQHYQLLQSSDAAISDNSVSLLEDIPSQAYRFFMAINRKFQTFVSKQVSALSIETSQALVSHLSNLLRSIASADELLTRGTIAGDLKLGPQFSWENGPILIELAWKFDLLKRCIFEGRMEIRVQGVETMQQELVKIYMDYLQNEPAQRDHPVPLYLAHFLLANRLVDYFVGVDSHPQLLTRCANIVGFLIVTDKYTETESDVIWRAVVNSQDTRFVEALYQMLIGFFGISPRPTILYLVKKALELPIHSFDAPTINLVRHLFVAIERLWKPIAPHHKLDMPPFHLVIGLIRQAMADDTLEPHKKREIYNFAVTELQRILQYGPRETDRKAIYRECIQDISDRRENSTGSLAVMTHMIGQNLEGELFELNREWDLTSLIVAEFASMIQAERSSITPSQMLTERLGIRLNMLQTIINYAPGTITTEAGFQLWAAAVGSEALNGEPRETAWMILIRVLRSSQKRNSFIDRCVRQYIPELEPRFYTLGCLSFVQDVGHYHLRLPAPKTENYANQEPTAGELLWQISLAAPPDTVEMKAIHSLVALYLDSPDIHRRTREATEAIHIEVVERCIHQLTAAAAKLKAYSDGTSSGEDEPMIIVASDHEVNLRRQSFSRSLMILKEFIRGVRSRPRYSPQLQFQPRLPPAPSEIKGERIQIRYQSFGGGGSTDIHTVEVGDLETVQGLHLRLVRLTGFSKFTAISGGQKVDMKTLSDRTLRDLKFEQKGLLLIQKVPDIDGVADIAPFSGLRPVEVEILKHFSEMYEVLGMRDNLGKEIFEFLVTFPPHHSITSKVCSEDTPAEEIFPSVAPFKVLYSIYTLRSSLAQQSQNEISSPYNLVNHGIRSMTSALSSLNFSIGSQDSDVDVTVGRHLLECLLSFLEKLSPSSHVAAIGPNPIVFINRLQTLIQDALSAVDSFDAKLLACSCFAVLLKVSLHSELLWNHLKETALCSAVLRRLLLEETNFQIRRTIADWIRNISKSLANTLIAPADEFIPYFWTQLSALIPNCLDHNGTAREFFESATYVFQAVGHAHRNTLSLPAYVQDWSRLLLRHVHEEFVGRETIDWIVLGLSKLLNWCFQISKSLDTTLQAPNNLLENVFQSHLFPEIPATVNDSRIELRVPELHTNTREELYAIVLTLSSDATNYHSLLKAVGDLFSQGEDSQAWSWGIAQFLEDYHYEPNWNFERSKCIRSSTGYPGLRNLSNTCYMNSLLTQLFMNVKFREFLLGTNVPDTSSQRLLQETQNLFGYMQETVLRSVDTQGIADSLITFDQTLIDVSVQMDVDEFYNLLFDRLEHQILLDPDKKKFRAFYGGQIVQQIKSKECPHISERLEPFNAIQCDISGRLTLADSLNAYVAGEVMEGDNKYSCTSCGSYVDAVKRACFKDIPNNLIFHLKRFDYDLMTGLRSKINDTFEFPTQIDMGPYHVDHLKDVKVPSTPDLFQLVGVLVHSGTAESGHYYSYVQERPPTSSGRSSWVEFNDADVTTFDPSQIADNCYGGYSEASSYANRYLKQWNAYMLFYERIDSELSSQRIAISRSTETPIKAKVPVQIQNQVALHNARWLRTYCMFDPAHASFARQLLEQLRIVNKGTCSENHDIERAAICMSLDYLERVLCRSKDCVEFTKMLASVSKVIGSCSTCCRFALEWVLDHEYALRNLLLRCPTPKIRKDFASMIIAALQYLKKNGPRWYGYVAMEDENQRSIIRELQVDAIFQRIITLLRELWPYLHIHPRAWDDYFGLIAEIVQFGVYEAHTVLNQGFLQGCLEILVMDHPKAVRLRTENLHYASYVRLVEKGRRFSMNKLVELVAGLLAKLDLKAEPVRRMQERRVSFKGMRLTKTEDEYMQWGSDLNRKEQCCIFLEKILNTATNPLATKRIIQTITLAEPAFGMFRHVQQTILNGINIDPASLAAPYLRAAITFCECAPDETIAQEVIRFIANEVATIGQSGGREHLEFFAQARRIQSLHSSIPANFFGFCVLRTVPQWAPELLLYWEDPVRKATLELLKVLVFSHDINMMDDEEHAELIETAAKDLQLACTRRCNVIVQMQKPIDSKSVEQIMSVMHCCEQYYGPDEDRRPIAEAENVLDSIGALTVSDMDDAASDTWNNASDDMPTDSDSELLNTSP